MKVKLGYGICLERGTPSDSLKYAVKAETMGFDNLWVEDHFQPWFHTNAKSSFAWTFISSLLQATKRVPVCTAVTCPTMRYHPAVVAQAFATMRSMYPGRAMLAVGSGEAMNEALFTGKWPSTPERLEMLRESVELMNKLWTSKEPFAFKGKYYPMNRVFLYTKPEDKVPVYFSAVGPNASRYAGLYGDHLITMGDCDFVKNFVVPTFEKGAREGGKDPGKMERVMVIGYSLDPDYDKAVENLCHMTAGSSLPAMFKYPVTDPMEVEMNGNMVAKEAVAKMSHAVTSTEELIKRIERYDGAGITNICMFNYSPNEELGLNAFKEIIPHFKK